MLRTGRFERDIQFGLGGRQAVVYALSRDIFDRSGKQRDSAAPSERYCHDGGLLFSQYGAQGVEGRLKAVQPQRQAGAGKDAGESA